MTGSRWYFPVYEGLFEGKHVAAMANLARGLLVCYQSGS